MEVMSSPPIDFDFNYDARISPYLTAPSTPKRFGEIYISAPTSPSRISEFYSEFDYFSIITPPTSKADHDSFTFFVEESNKSTHSADEIFDGSKIKPLKEDNNLLEYSETPLVSPKHPNVIIHEDFSPTKKNECHVINNNNPFGNSINRESGVTRGRNKTPSIASSKSSRQRLSRSLSPYREHQYTCAEESKQESNNENVIKSSSTTPLKSSRKWRLRDLLLFRSTSEGSSRGKDSLMKYFKKDKYGKCSCFSSIENPTMSSRKKPISPHELHYARKKAETDNLKKKTFLPYKQGILGRLSGITT
ncbi:hypothetical protein Lal_00005027 [Lupinus albus]|uniref:Uncharacterized protein n=1 Tax=Lupinus albus TaxID=3870 RepID=A0A6A5M209_LUPAL|nr:hypothetical protein Lalb_Chr23g0266941 [Lupinus albus]KAF1865650.1 hypothetical protein Lal_00005027 [Lupinus albus]